ncbi:hypothetical protein GNQ08_18295 [Paenibacillus macerans]|uniref:Uncharacterized protein n=1 Tax=Paenibacillus macerans TaxID=44252 RepID=A0A6N8F022_PAEMA|nr:hypothetical protein [Paenibacillus macerans]MED4954509.1 hypothetical protein [Paenibacillus macerans]MUG24333.1 hypothetical protein [Paenibacillus macerans]UMV50342.1 hypothetical protein LMZ02_13750 [Paenibacillus macerans]
MELPLWFRDAIQERLNHITARINRHPELRKLRAEERSALEAMFFGTDQTKSPEYMDWEDKHHFRQGLENERLYMQGMMDGVQLAIALLKPNRTPNPAKSDTERKL